MKDSQEKHNAYEWGIFWMLLSATSLSVSMLFLKVNAAQFNYFTLLFLRFCVPFLFVLALIIGRRDWNALFVSHRIKLQLLRCFCVLVAQYSLAFYIARSSLLNATVLLNAAPIFIPLIEWIFVGHRPGKSTLAGASVAFFGVILVLHPDRSLFTALSGIGLLAALGQAGSQVLYGLKSKTENLLVSLFYLFFFTTLISSITVLWVSFSDAGFQHVQHPQAEHAWLLVISVSLMAVGTLFNQYFQGLAYRFGTPSTLATFLYFSVFVSAVLDWLIFKRIPTFLTIIGGCLIILGGILKVFLRSRILKRRAKK